MENKKLKQKLKRVRTKLAALTLATSMVFPLGACGNHDQENEQIGFAVESQDQNDDTDGLYCYVINREGLESNIYDFSSCYYKKVFAKVVKSKEHGTNFWNNMTTAYYKKNLRIIWPDCFNCYDESWLGYDNFDYTLKIEKFEEYLGLSYIIVNSSITANRDLPFPLDKIKRGQRNFKENDTMSSTAIYCDGELVAYKQTGVGSDCKNVIEATVGDVDLAISTVEQLSLLDETKIVTEDELYQQQESLNTIEKNKMKEKINKN